MENFITVDIETTGLFPGYYNEIIEIAAIKTLSDGTKEVFHEYIKPTKPLPKKIVEITGLTDDFLENKGNRKDILHKFNLFIENKIIVAYNATFDINFLNFWFLYYRLPMITKHTCCMKLFKSVTKEKKAKLSYACKYYNLTNNKEHSAIEDAIVTDKLFFLLINAQPPLIISTPKEEAFIKACKKLSNSKMFVNSKETLCFSPDIKQHTPEEVSPTNIICYFKKGLSPYEISIKYKQPFNEVIKVYFSWINRLNYSYVYHHFADKQAFLFARNILNFSKNIKDAKKLHEKIFDNNGFNLFFYSTVYILSFKKNSMKYNVNDFEYYFKKQASIKEISKKIEMPTLTIMGYYIQWLTTQNNLNKKEISFYKDISLKLLNNSIDVKTLKNEINESHMLKSNILKVAKQKTQKTFNYIHLDRR